MKNDTGLLAALDGLIQKHHLLKHPFYVAWTEGRLERSALALYAEQYYQHVKAFPEQLKVLAGRADNGLRAVVQENLAEELDPAAPHPVLWRQFAEAMGVEQDRLESAASLPGIAALLDTFDELAELGSMEQAVAAFYAYEAQVPEIAGQKMAGLRRFYGVEDPEALAYFSVHEEADVRHRTAWREWLGGQPNADRIDVLGAAERALKALWGALDAVYAQPCAAH